MYILFSLCSRKRLLGAGQTTGQEDFCGIADGIVAFAASSRTRSTQRRVAWQRLAANCRTGLPFSRCSAMHCVTSKVSLSVTYGKLLCSAWGPPSLHASVFPANFLYMAELSICPASVFRAACSWVPGRCRS